MEERSTMLLLEDEIRDQIHALNQLDFGSKEHTEAVHNIESLTKLLLDSRKLDAQNADRNDRWEIDEKNRIERVHESRLDRYVKIGMGIFEVCVPLVFYGIWMNKGFKFEETGTFTSTTFRGLFQKFKPGKR